MPTETQHLEQRVAALQSDLNTKDEQIDDLSFQLKDREGSRRDWLDEAKRLEKEVEALRKALKFYADREHYHFESGNWDTVSGEPLNILWCGDEPDFIEDGTVARTALSACAEPSDYLKSCEAAHRALSLEPSAPVERDERAEFESYMRREFPGACLLLNQLRDGYGNPSHQGAWLSWQARAALDKATEGASHQCKACHGEGVIHTGIDESPTTICNRCEGLGHE